MPAGRHIRAELWLCSSFPFLLVVGSVAQNMADVDSPEAVIDLGNKPVLVSFYVKDSPLRHGIGACECFAHICQILPKCFLGDAKTGVQCRFDFRMPLAS
jgi:hypothetical protein